MKNLLDTLNEKQKDAVVHHTGPLLVRAGPGTGKTTVITHRIAHLIRERNVIPERILAITFTNKATQVMQNRLVDEELIDVADSTEVKVSTFNAFCQDVLRQHGPMVDLPSNFLVCDEQLQTEFLIECLYDLNLVNKHTITNRIKWLSQGISYYKSLIYDPIESISFIDSLGKNRAIYPEFIDKCDILYDTYQMKLNEHNMIDFDDQIIKTVELLENMSDVQEIYLNSIHHLLVDEYHDVNSLQYRLLQLLCGRLNPNLMVVADEDQAIYGWRGADVKYINRFVAEFNPDVIHLSEHFRCNPTILKSAEKVLAPTENKVTIFHKKHSETERPIWHYSHKEDDKEVNTIIKLITQIDTEGEFTYKDIAILFRNHKSADKVVAKLFENGITFKRVKPTISIGNKYYQGFISYLRLLLNYISEEPNLEMNYTELKRAFNFPYCRIDDLTWVKLKWLAEQNGMKFIVLLKNIEDFPQVITPLIRRNISDFWELIERLSYEINGRNINGIIQSILGLIEKTRSPYQEEEINILIESNDDPNFSTTAKMLNDTIIKNEDILITTYDDIDESYAGIIIQGVIQDYYDVNVGIRIISEGASIPTFDSTKFNILIGDFPETILRTIDKNKTILICSKMSNETVLLQLSNNCVKSIIAMKLAQKLLEIYAFMEMMNFVFYDLETRGVNVENAEIVEIAAHRINNETIEVEKFQQLVRPPRGHLPKSSTDVNKITEDMVEDSPSINEVLPSFFEFIENCIIVGHNVIAFDNPILQRCLYEYLNVELTDNCYDTLITARRLFPRKSASLESLAEMFNIEHGNLHRADKDVEVTRKVYENLIEYDRRICRIHSLVEYLPIVGTAILSKLEDIETENTRENKAFLSAATRFLKSVNNDDTIKCLNNSILTNKNLEKITELIGEIRNKTIPETPEDINWILHRTEFLNNINDLPTTDSNIAKLSDYVSLYDSLIDVDDLEENEQLTLMTLHSSKGTEFPIVIIIGMNENSAALDDSERRLYYVGMTRAKERLYFTSVFNPETDTEEQLMFSEIPSDYIKRWSE